MQTLKKLGFFIVFFVTLSQIMGDSVSRSGVEQFVFENQENKPLSNEYFSFEFDEQEFDGVANISLPLVYALITKESIHSIGCQKYPSYNFILWQPPQIILI